MQQSQRPPAWHTTCADGRRRHCRFCALASAPLMTPTTASTSSLALMGSLLLLDAAARVNASHCASHTLPPARFQAQPSPQTATNSMCLASVAPTQTEEAGQMEDSELAAVLVCRQQQPERVIGLAAGRHDRVLVTVQGDGVISYSAANETSGHSRALGAASQALLLAPVQQLDSSSYVAAVQPQGSAHGVLLTTPVSVQQPKPLLDAEQQLPLPSKLHSLHVLQPAATSSAGGSSSRHQKTGRGGVAAVVLADGTVAAANFGQLRLHAAATNSAAAAAAGSSQRAAAAAHRLLAAACSGQLLAVAKQPQGVVAVDIYSCSSDSSADSSSNGVADADADADAAPAIQQQQPSQPGLQLRHSISIPAPSSASKLVGLSVSNQGLLLVLWSCHTVSICHTAVSSTAVNSMQLPPSLAAVVAADDGSTQQADNNKSTSKRKQRSAAAAAAASGGGDWTAVALSGQHVLLAAVEGGAGSSCRVHYALLDSTYGSCLSTGAFSAGSAAAPAAGRLQLMPLPEHAFAPAALLVHGSVWLLPLQLPKADLAGLVANLGLGSSQAHAAAAAAAPDSAQLLLTSRQQLNLSAIAASVSKQQQPQGACILQQLRQPAAAATPAAATGTDSHVKAAVQQVWQVLEQQKRPAQALHAAVSQLCDVLEQQQQQQQQQHEAGTVSGAPQPKQQRVSQQQQAATSVLVSQQLLAAALAALSEAQQWDVLERLHQQAPLQSLAACADVLPALAAAEQYGLMRRVLAAAQEVPADAVVRALQCVLQPRQQEQEQQEAGGGDSSSSGPSAAQLAAAQQIRAAAEAVVQQAEAAAAVAAAGGPPDDAAQALTAAARHAAAAVDGFTSRELLLHVLLWAQVDVVEAQPALRALPASVVLRLLRYMIKWLHKLSRNSLTARSSDPLLLTPGAAQVVEWCKLLLDAQLTKLMLIPAAGPLLQQLQRLLRAEVSCTSRLAALKGAADHWAAGASLPAAAVAANSQYVLELLDLRVTPPQPAAAAAGTAAGRRSR